MSDFRWIGQLLLRVSDEEGIRNFYNLPFVYRLQVIV